MKTNLTIASILSLLVIGGATQASVKDEIKALYQAKGINTSVSSTAAAAPEKIVRLKNGRAVNAAEWKIVLFMQGNCGYCQQFDPVLKALSQKTGIKVFPYTLDGRGDMSFPSVIPATQEVVKTFFEQLPVVTPSTFLINVNSLKTVPILQGATDESRFMRQLDHAFERILVGDNRDAN
ncbi:MAG TPA: type-F conjugative transfer system pilin assembly thiol-disulfide isomerase TrbB [Arsenophonus nasoniae]|uniref:type-F conjugative transfer system pilin assembly thiol-disulfide isomerase TrbB n=1 Tax=Arsenophonus nasoniae TaxID=638 RepID=UPI00387A6981